MKKRKKSNKTEKIKKIIAIQACPNNQTKGTQTENMDVTRIEKLENDMQNMQQTLKSTGKI